MNCGFRHVQQLGGFQHVQPSKESALHQHGLARFQTLELLQSLYGSEPMWRLYVTPSNGSATPTPSAPNAPSETTESIEEESPWST